MRVPHRVRKAECTLILLALVIAMVNQSHAVPLDGLPVSSSAWTGQGATIVGALRFEHPWRLVAMCSWDNEVMVQLDETDETETHASSREVRTSLRFACTGHTVTSHLLQAGVSYIVAVTAMGPWSMIALMAPDSEGVLPFLPE